MAKLVRTDEETMLADSARGFLDENAPVSHLRRMRDAGQIFDRTLWKQMAEMGWTGILVPEECGGSAMGHSAACVLAGEMGRTLVQSPFISTAVIGATVYASVMDTRSRDALAAIASGDMIVALAMDENAKFDPERIDTKAEKVGNGYRISGTKRLVLGGVSADRLMVLAQTENGPTLFEISPDSQGVARDGLQMIDSTDAADIRLDAVEVDGDAVLGALGGAMDVLEPALRAGQAALAAEMTGLAGGAMAMTVAYLKDRKQFGVPIGAFQALQHRAAHLWCECEVTASAVLNAGRLLDEDPDNAQMAVSLAKARATDTAQLAVREGVQMHGGIGMTDAFDMGFFMKRARVAAEWLGDYGYHANIVAQARGF
ncbi:acyl-CoA dehydrogenase family protein [Lutimaribacter marinistellae]|uniref:Acyl-CoA dehydrogenase family protein n=1 Tax=Lutimaribacter marinistellae TaxID=1820329 RepID=A0ABV7TLT1_9RHOB